VDAGASDKSEEISLDQSSDNTPDKPLPVSIIAPKTSEELVREYEVQRQGILLLKAKLAQNQIDVLNN